MIPQQHKGRARHPWRSLFVYSVVAPGWVLAALVLAAALRFLS